MLIKLSDYIAKELANYGVKHVFMVSGGGAMHLNDSLGKHPKIEYICNHHEQASAIAAEGYARLHQKLTVVNVTTGPGGINALNGVFGQWTDSIPVLYISGQVKYETTLDSCKKDVSLRQLGDQEVDIISMVKPIVKYAEMVKNPNDIKKILHKAIHLATSGRPGPTWIDIPINFQGAMIDEDNLVPAEDMENEDFIGLEQKSREVIDLINKAKRPVIVAGHGVRISKSEEVFYRVIEKLNLPILTTFNGFDVIASDHPQFIGRIGSVGQRAGNFALQNADLILFLGTRNNIRQVSYNWEMFARRAKKIVIDVDKSELHKPTLKIDLPIHADLKKFLISLEGEMQKVKISSHADWLDWCDVRKKKYDPQKNPEYLKNFGRINPYKFAILLTKNLQENSIMIAGNGTACVSLFHAGIVKDDQRIFWNSGNASMGYDLPAAIGACFANDKKDVICLAGDGSIMMNLQELQTVKHYNLPIKIFILNNDGYSSIRQTQRNFFGEELVACSSKSGVSTPNFVNLAKAFELPSMVIEANDDLEDKISKVLTAKGPMVCEVMLDHDYIFQPKLSSERLADGRMISKPLEDMFPFLDRSEFEENMIKD